MCGLRERQDRLRSIVMIFPFPELDLGNSKEWRRVAIVADANFIFRAAFPAFSKLVPVETKLFGIDDEDDANAWVTG